MSEFKAMVAKAAIKFIDEGSIIGVGTGSTVNYFIQELAIIKHRIEACVASSIATEGLLRKAGIPVIDLNVAGELPLYIDGADEVDAAHCMIKGGGGALTREKILASAARNFICIVDESKLVEQFGDFPIAVEVLSMARSFVARELLKLGGNPIYREGFISDNGHIILDVFDLNLSMPHQLEEAINNIPGVLGNGIFAHTKASLVLVASADGVREQ